MSAGNHKTLPYLTAELPGIAGVIKTRPEDFVVEELPRYEFSDQGDHLLIQIEKKGMATLDALLRISRALGVPRKNIGYAGLKDALAITRQWISIEHLDPEKLQLIDHPDIKICQHTRHNNKLKLGHLSANRFTIRIRNFQPGLEQAYRSTCQIMDILIARGVPNYFGQQRFGNRNDAHLLGEAIIQKNVERFIDLLLGKPNVNGDSAVNSARILYEGGQFEQARNVWPANFHDQLRALNALIKSDGDKKRAYNVIDKRFKRFYVSAYQSDLFNQVTVIRMPDLDKLLLGDLAYKHENGACFHVEDPAAEQPRCAAFEISPTGPMFGYRSPDATGPAGEIENRVLSPTGLTKEDFRQMNYYRIRGTRRALRYQPRNIDISKGSDDLGGFIQLKFDLDSGCYATTLLREINKT